MRIKKIMSAALAACMAATAALSTGAFSASAADSTLTFDIRSGEKNAVSISAADIAAGDITVPFDIYIPENPGVNGINLKLQINDGEVKDDGTFGNYGLYLTDAAFAKPYCFDSANSGDAAKSFGGSAFNAEKMNINWLFNEDVTKNADAYAEAATTAWDNTVSWAYENAFAQGNLVVPKGTAAGTYQLDIRTEPYDNALGGSDKQQKSACSCAEQETGLSFTSVPLTVTVEEAPAATGDPWVKDYKIDTTDHYLVIGDAAGKPGETVNVPIYVYNDQGTSGMQLNISYDKDLVTLKECIDPEENYAYMISPEPNVNVFPALWVFAQAAVDKAADGSILTYLSFTIPEDAKPGTSPIEFTDGTDAEGKVTKTKIVGEVAQVGMDVKLINGSVTVLAADETALNYTALDNVSEGDIENLTIFNATGDVTWSSSDEAVATVDQNGFVTIKGDGAATITAANGGKEYTCTISNSDTLFGDVDHSGTVDITDAQLVLITYTEYMVSEKHTLPEADLPIANVSGDVDDSGNPAVDITDAQMILLYYVEDMAENSPSWYAITKNPNAPDAPKE